MRFEPTTIRFRRSYKRLQDTASYQWYPEGWIKTIFLWDQVYNFSTSLGPACAIKRKCSKKSGLCQTEECANTDYAIKNGCKGPSCNCCAPCVLSRKCERDGGICMSVCPAGYIESSAKCKKTCKCCVPDGSTPDTTPGKTLYIIARLNLSTVLLL